MSVKGHDLGVDARHIHPTVVAVLGLGLAHEGVPWVSLPARVLGVDEVVPCHDRCPLVGDRVRVLIGSAQHHHRINLVALLLQVVVGITLDLVEEHFSTSFGAGLERHDIGGPPATGHQHDHLVPNGVRLLATHPPLWGGVLHIRCVTLLSRLLGGL